MNATKKGDVTYKREIFSSPVDNAIIVYLTADKPGALSFNVNLSRNASIPRARTFRRAAEVQFWALIGAFTSPPSSEVVSSF